MSNEDLNKTPSSPVTETPAGGMGQPNGAKSKAEVGKQPASAADLSATIELLLEQNKALQSENARLAAKLDSGSPANAESSFDKLAELLSEALGKKAKSPEEVNPENLNKTAAFNTKNQIDGQSLMEAQAMLLQFRDERKVPISVPKLLASYIGPQLAVSVNGVRVSIPADGKTYFINETHALAARERMAKINLIQSKSASNIVTIGDADGN